MNALVTGASRGIGRAIAIALAKEGYNVAINYSASETAAKEVASIVESHGVKSLLVKGNVGDFLVTQKMVLEVLEQFGNIDCLVNNAGVVNDKVMLRMSEQDFKDVINVNLVGTWNMIKHVTKPMLKQRSGTIINISSVVAHTGNFGQANYVASKAGVIGLTKSLAKEFGGKGVRVNAVAPGLIETDMTNKIDDSIKNDYFSKIPLKRFGSAEDIANAVQFLASDKSKYITGEVINVNGGMV